MRAMNLSRVLRRDGRPTLRQRLDALRDRVRHPATADHSRIALREAVTALPLEKPARPTLDPRVLASATMVDLLCYFEAFERADDAMVGIMNMPRCGNDASVLIEDECERFRWLQISVVNEVRRRSPTDRGLEIQAEILTRWAFMSGPFSDNDPRLKVLIALVEADA